MEQPIRVLHMIGCFEAGGSQAMVLNLLQAMDRTRVQFDFVVDNPDRMEWAGRAESLGAKIYTLPKFSGTNFLQVKNAWDCFFKEHPEYKILHSHVRSYASIYIPIAKKHGLKTIIHSHNTSNGNGLMATAKRILQYPLRFQADYFMACSMEAAQWLFGKKVAQSDRCRVLKNAIDVRLFRDDPACRTQYREKWNLQHKKVYIHVGRMTPQKNHGFLIDVFAGIHQKDPNAVLVCVGDGEQRKTIEQRITAYQLSDSVLLLGNRRDVPALLNMADCFLFPSSWEGLGIVAVEAQAAGLPCICSDQVPTLAKVTDNCVFLPLEKDVWVENALNIQCAQKDCIAERVAEAGYDIFAVAEWLQNFYLQFAENTK